MNNIEFFQACEKNLSVIKEYETNSIAFLNKWAKLSTEAKNQARQCMSNPLKKDFHKELRKKFKSYFGSIFASQIFKMVILCIIFGLILIIGFGFAETTKEEIPFGFDEKFFSVFGTGITSNLINVITMSISFAVSIGFVIIWFKWSGLKSLSTRLSKRDDVLSELLCLVPQKLRCYDGIDTVVKIYYEYPDITPAQAIDIGEGWLRDHPSSSLPGIMFDIPYRQPNISASNSSQPINQADQPLNSTQEDDTTKKEEFVNPNLPKDIHTKTFEGSDNAQRDLDAMIGLTEVKEQIERMKNRISFYGSSNIGNSGNHMVFFGGAGVGKSVTARIVTRILYDLGYIKENKCVEIDGDYLKSSYVGATGERTSAIVDYALGGVLFIDEAYLLYDKNASSAEATGVLLKAMEDHREDFVVILAGYEEQMTKLLASNEGFSSRIKYKVYFPDYTAEEMYQIFSLFLSRYDNNKVYFVDEKAKQLLLKLFELEKTSKSFGNGRTARNAVDAVMDNYADRMVKEGSKSNTITYEDVYKYYEQRAKELQHDIRNAAAVNQLDESIIRLSELKPHIKQGSDHPEKDELELVGLDSMLEEIKLLGKEKEFYGADRPFTSNNFLLVGEPGCGKSSLVNILTGYLYKFNYIKENRYLDISSDILKGSYVGHTTRRAEAIINYARGGVLYIRNLSLVANSDDSFAQEAMSNIFTALTSNTDVIIVVSDTLNNIRQLLQRNPSFESVFQYKFIFPEYTTDDLLNIINKKAVSEGFRLDPNLLLELNNKLNKNNYTVREVNNLYEKIKKYHIANYTPEKDKYLLTDEYFKNAKPLKFNLKK